jgi:RimJ/RimL family protein N-acetyltransferase
VIETDRLILRPWAEADRAAFLAMSADPEVMVWLGGAPTPEAANQRFDRFAAGFDERGYTRWAIERRQDAAFLGYAGLAPVPDGLPVAGVEAGWGLARAAWGFGYAGEAARAAVADGFERLKFDEIIAFTADTNRRSQAVMGRAGLARDPTRDFDHPNVPESDPIRHHWVYAAKRAGWSKARAP